jgi:adenylate cyclase
VRILRRGAEELVGRELDELFPGRNRWVVKSLEKVRGSGHYRHHHRHRPDRRRQPAISVNLVTVPLTSMRDEAIGYMLMMEDITREKRLRNTMSRYMSKSVVDKLMESGEAELGGIGRDVSVLFSDIRGFTSISERLGAKETVALLNEYFTDMVDIVFAHNGVLDKYIGDMIMAVFGSVLQSAEDASNAVVVGNKMMTALHVLNRRRTARSEEPIRIGVGISTGNVVAGNIGSLKRMEYTVIGDRVNLAERLEGANKFYGTSILICDATWAAVKHHAATREIDLIRVRGRSTPVAITRRSDTIPKTASPIARKPSMPSAPACGTTAAATGSAPSAISAKRWRQIPATARPGSTSTAASSTVSTPPPDDWDGVWEMKHK